MKEYNGHRSWNCWNVSLWIMNDENIYNFALRCIDCPLCGRKKDKIRFAVNRFMDAYKGEKTPDSAKYTALAVKECLLSLCD